MKVPIRMRYNLHHLDLLLDHLLLKKLLNLQMQNVKLLLMTLSIQDWKVLKWQCFAQLNVLKQLKSCLDTKSTLMILVFVKLLFKLDYLQILVVKLHLALVDLLLVSKLESKMELLQAKNKVTIEHLKLLEIKNILVLISMKHICQPISSKIGKKQMLKELKMDLHNGLILVIPHNMDLHLNKIHWLLEQIWLMVVF